jgi:precorrin-2 dehydrogenase/sirohydrochlorin ferrochelatase
MSYFPAFLQLEKKNILIVGGGKIANDKLKHLLDFTNKIDLIANEFSDEILTTIEEKSLYFEKRFYKEGDIASYDIAILAIDDISLQASIYEESKRYKCLCNSVDSEAYCDFIFPSYIKKEELTIAISTSGASPSVAKYLRLYLQNLIPENIGDFLKEMRKLRQELPKGKERMKMLDSKVKKYFETWNK